ncbi:MAG: peptidylprolyl isomerase [Proteobacteria bacterium]|nr:MAG: peptidylprolyl isomerase [Pseudomonadota bacterium]
MAQAAAGDSVRVHYTGRLNDGTVFDSSEGRDPLDFTLGSGQVIPGFDEAVTGMTVGESVTITIEPENAYGERREEMVQQVPRSDIPDDIDLAVGMQLQASGPQGDIVVTVIEMSDETIKLDANHPLAGKALTFDLQLVEIG